MSNESMDNFIEPKADQQAAETITKMWELLWNRKYYSTMDLVDLAVGIKCLSDKVGENRLNYVQIKAFCEAAIRLKFIHISNTSRAKVLSKINMCTLYKGAVCIDGKFTSFSLDQLKANFKEEFAANTDIQRLKNLL